jgi:hypothetical protein
VILLAVAEKPFQQATEYVRSHGSVVAIGLPANAYLRAPVFTTVVRMISIKGSYVGNRQDGAEALDFFARGLIKAPFKTVPLKDLPRVFELMGGFHFPSFGPFCAFFFFYVVLMLIITLVYRARKDCWKVCTRDTRVMQCEVRDQICCIVVAVGRSNAVSKRERLVFILRNMYTENLTFTRILQSAYRMPCNLKKK